jgi:protein-disulfide isomerase
MSWTRRSLLVTGAAGLGAAGYWAYTERAFNLPGENKPTAPPQPGSPLFGDMRAPKRLVVWGSYTCPYTAMLIPVLMNIVKDLPQRVNLEWRHFPNHPPDPALHVAGLGFKNEHFWGFTSAVLALVYAAGGSYDKLTPEKLTEFAIAEGGSEATLRSAYADKSKWAAVKDDFLAGQLLGINTTPGLFYDGYFLTPLGVPLDLPAFDKSLRAMVQHV